MGRLKKKEKKKKKKKKYCSRVRAFFIERVGVRHVWWGYAASSEADYVLGNHFDFALRVSLSLTTIRGVVGGFSRLRLLIKITYYE